MVLNPESKYPTRRAYVVKLQNDATPATLVGRVENLVTGHQRDFACAGELLRAISADLAVSAGSQAEDSAED